MGLLLRLRSDREEVLSAAEATFRGFGPAPAAPDALAAPDLDFRFLVRDGAGDSAITVDRAGGRAWGRLTPALLADPARLRAEFLELALQLMLPARGFLGVHGAAVVRGRRAALLRAGGGGGKTTLAYAAAARGRLQVLAEDVVWIDAAHGLWWGLPWWLHPRMESRTLFPELAGRRPALRRGGSDKLAVEVESIRPGSAVPSALAGPVVLLERRPRAAASRITALGLPEALELWAAGRAGTEEQVPDYPRRVRRLLAGNAWKLEMGADLDEALARIEELLAAAERPPGAAASPAPPAL